MDLRIGPLIDKRGDGYMMAGLKPLVPYFNAAGWLSGATFKNEDGMHFEVSKETLGDWIDDKAGLYGRGLGGVDTLYLGETGALTAGKNHLVLVDGAGAIDGTGNNNDNVLVGNTAANRLWGMAHDDVLRGREGGDTLMGGLGVDSLFGGLGNDWFVFGDAAVSTVAGADTIRDWNAGDRIDLSAIDANVGASGDQLLTYIAASAFSHSPGQLQVTNNGVNTFVRADLDGDGSADFSIRLSGVHSLTRRSFIL